MILYVVRYEDGDVEYCSFYKNQRDAHTGRTKFRRKFKKFKSGSVQRVDVGRGKECIINLFDKYAIKYRERK